jgi:non-ribosomal peptide synthetase component F
MSNVSFDAATFEIWGALLNGGCLVAIDRDVALAPDRLGAALRDQRISVMFVTTALFNQLAEVEGVFASLRCVLFGGEAVDPGRVRAVLAHGAPEHLLHVYGPTENTTFSTWHEVCDDGPHRATDREHDHLCARRRDEPGADRCPR